MLTFQTYEHICYQYHDETQNGGRQGINLHADVAPRDCGIDKIRVSREIWYSEHYKCQLQSGTLFITSRW
jgi:hypothetical protein